MLCISTLGVRASGRGERRHEGVKWVMYVINDPGGAGLGRAPPKSEKTLGLVPSASVEAKACRTL